MNHGRFELISGDGRDYETVPPPLVKTSDCVFHEAASKLVVSLKNPRIDLDTNIVNTFNILEASKNTDTRIIHAWRTPVSMSYGIVNRTLLPDPNTDHKVIVVIPAYKEAEKIRKNKVTEILVIDDGPTDGCCDNLPTLGASVLWRDERRFIGVAVRNGPWKTITRRSW